MFHSSTEIQKKKKIKNFELIFSTCCTLRLPCLPTDIKKKGCDLAGCEAEFVIMHLVVKAYGNTTHRCSIYARDPSNNHGRAIQGQNTRIRMTSQKRHMVLSSGSCREESAVMHLRPTCCTARCNIKNVYSLPTEFICMFCRGRRTHNDYFCMQH
jgi:hypothetical protein